MPGYYAHLASCHEKALLNPSFRLGVEIPDLLKTYYKVSPNYAQEKYNLLKTKDMPEYSYFAKRLKEEERPNVPKGMHYGLSNNPNVLYFFSSLSNTEKTNPFFLGYLWHLLTDLLCYQSLNVDNIFNEYLKTQDISQKNNLLSHKLSIIHEDWDKINKKILEQYPSLNIPSEIKELDFINFKEGNPLFINETILFKIISYLRDINPLDANMLDIINNIYSLIDPNSIKREKKLG